MFAKYYLTPVLGVVRAGVPIHAEEDIIDYEEIPQEMARSGEYFGLRVTGSSMEPTLRDGDVIIVRKQPDVDNGDIAIVLVDGEDATVKEIRETPKGVNRDKIYMYSALRRRYGSLFAAVGNMMAITGVVMGIYNLFS